ncbi:glycosyltransferase family 8 protein [Micromonospora sp. SH-82]|uniref:glycosyltransferase family 8 protein n=1 Tax=Micromonospora sp. SH-82 TaxID=3132938 RepID=UPI003EB796C9
MSRQDVHVVFAIDERYARPAVVTGRSVRRNLRDEDTRLVFHVIDSGLADEGRAVVTEGLAAEGEVELHRVADPLVMEVPRKWWTDAALGRLHIGAVIPTGIPRVVYLDADTLVLDDLTDLLAEDLAGNAVGAGLNEVGPARSLTFADGRAHQHQTGALPPGHFNSGVLLIDMDRWRAERATERCMELHRTYGRDLPNIDQDILNHIFAGRWTPLPEKWNKLIEHSVHGIFGNGRMDYLTRPEGIVHYIGKVKPWHDAFPDNPLRHRYEEYALAPAR